MQSFKTAPGYFYPRPPRGGRHAAFNMCEVGFIFLSTPSARRATSAGVKYTPKFRISIHALREEGDQTHSKGSGCPYIISIHALREEGDSNINDRVMDMIKFLSTPSARRATYTQYKQFMYL